MSNKRVVIVDYNHIAYKLAYAPAAPLLHYVTDPATGATIPIPTNVQSGSMKSLFRWSRGGYDALAVCFDRPCPQRKVYFREAFSEEETGGSGDYKGQRDNVNDQLMNAINMTQKMLERAGVPCYYGNGYEADDLIFAVLQAAKEEYPDRQIDIVTGDADLIPLVDDQVSVFMRSMKNTESEHNAIKKNKYVQITPKNYQSVIEGMSAYKNYTVPYNSLLLVKMLRGDSSDNIPGVPNRVYTPTRLRQIIEELQSVSALDLGNIFRYGGDLAKMTFVLAPFMLGPNTLGTLWGIANERGNADFEEFFNHNGVFDQDLLSVDAVRQAMIDDGTKDGFGGLRHLSHARRNYIGMNLNTPFGTGENIPGDIRSRKAARAKAPGGYDEFKYATSAEELGIKIDPSYEFDYSF